MPDCKYCGETIGNKGALSTHETHCDEKPDNDAELGRQAARQAEANEQQAQPPAQPQQAQGGAQPPARGQQAQQGQNLPAQQQQGAVNAGLQLGSAVSKMATGDQRQQAQAKGQLAQSLGGMIAQAGSSIAEKEMQEVENAKQTSSDQLQKSDEYPDCPECGNAITKIPQGQGEFPCPHCGTPLEKR